MLELELTDQAMKEYEAWIKKGDAKTLDKIDVLLESCCEDPFRGLGSPEPLRHNLSGMWSRRITKHDRLVYEVGGGVVTVHQLMGHYSEK